MDIKVYHYWDDLHMVNAIRTLKECKFSKMRIIENAGGINSYFYIYKSYCHNQIRIGLSHDWPIKGMRSDHDGWWVCNRRTTTWQVTLYAATREYLDRCMSELTHFFHTPSNQKNKDYEIMLEVEDWENALEQIKKTHWKLEITENEYEDFPSVEEVYP